MRLKGIEEDVEKLHIGETAEPDFISKSSEIGQESAYITEGLRADELRKRKMETFELNEFVFEYKDIDKCKSNKD